MRDTLRRFGRGCAAASRALDADATRNRLADAVATTDGSIGSAEVTAAQSVLQHRAAVLRHRNGSAAATADVAADRRKRQISAVKLVPLSSTGSAGRGFDDDDHCGSDSGRRTGATAVEYGLIVAVLSLPVVAGHRWLRHPRSNGVQHAAIC